MPAEPMPTPDEIVTQFGYLLNAMEAAAQQPQPAAWGYGQKRQAVFDFVRQLAEGKAPHV